MIGQNDEKVVVKPFRLVARTTKPFDKNGQFGREGGQIWIWL